MKSVLPLNMDYPIAAAIAAHSWLATEEVLHILERTKSVDKTLAAMDYSAVHNVTTNKAINAVTKE